MRVPFRESAVPYRTIVVVGQQDDREYCVVPHKARVGVHVAGLRPGVVDDQGAVGRLQLRSEAAAVDGQHGVADKVVTEVRGVRGPGVKVQEGWVLVGVVQAADGERTHGQGGPGLVLV